MNPLRKLAYVFTFMSLAFASSVRAEHWSELNIGPFYVDYDGDSAAAREVLTQLEQLRWVMGGLLESKDLRAVWPLRVIVSKSAQNFPTSSVTEFVQHNGSYQLLTLPSVHVPLGQVAAIFLESNTPRLPPEVESGIQQLFDTLEAHGSRVTWGANPVHPDLAWARMQLFATKFEYGASFHIFIASLRGGSTLRAAERNAFGRDPAAIEKEVAEHLAKADWQSTSVSGRPLDPKRDFGEHTLDPVIANVYLANTQVTSNTKFAEDAYKKAIEAGGEAAALGFEGLAEVARLNKEDPQTHLKDAIRAHSVSAPVYAAAAQYLRSDEALAALKQAEKLNPAWAEPVFRQAEFAADLREKETLIKRATQLDPRISRYWIELAQVQIADGHADLARGSWLRAEDSAKNEQEREHIHQMRLAAEQGRLDALEAERKREREEFREADRRAQLSEADRIHEAEKRANRQLDAAAGDAQVGDAIPYSTLVPKKKVSGSLTQVDCLRRGARLVIKTKSGESLSLFVKDAAPLNLTCGPQKPLRRVAVTYSAQPDETRHTVGDINEFAWQ